MIKAKILDYVLIIVTKYVRILTMWCRDTNIIDNKNKLKNWLMLF